MRNNFFVKVSDVAVSSIPLLVFATGSLALVIEFDCPQHVLVEYPNPLFQNCDENCICESFGFKIDTNIFKQCTNKIKKYYLDGLRENKKNVVDYTESCNNVGINYKVCAEEIIRLKKLCYDMTTAAELYNKMGKEFYQKVLLSGKIQMNALQWNALKDVENLNIYSCMIDLADKKSIRYMESVLYYFLVWFKKNERNYCQCNKVLGIGIIVEKLIYNKENASELIGEYFNSVCSYRRISSVDWTIDHFKEMARGGKILERSQLFYFLIDGEKLVESGWSGDKLNKYPFSKILDEIKIGVLDKSKWLIRLVAYAIKYDFTLKDIKNYKIITAIMFLNLNECRFEKLLDSIFKKDGNYTMEKRNSEKPNFHRIAPKTMFVMHFNILLTLQIRSSGKPVECDDFNEVLMSFKTILYNSAWTLDNVTKMLKTSNKRYLGTKTVIPCLKYLLFLDSKLYKNKWLDSSSDQDVQFLFGILRERFFKMPASEILPICTLKNSNYYDISKESGVIALLNYVMDINIKADTLANYIVDYKSLKTIISDAIKHKFVNCF